MKKSVPVCWDSEQLPKLGGRSRNLGLYHLRTPHARRPTLRVLRSKTECETDAASRKGYLSPLSPTRGKKKHLDLRHVGFGAHATWELKLYKALIERRVSVSRSRRAATHARDVMHPIRTSSQTVSQTLSLPSLSPSGHVPYSPTSLLSLGAQRLFRLRVFSGESGRGWPRAT